MAIPPSQSGYFSSLDETSLYYEVYGTRLESHKRPQKTTPRQDHLQSQSLPSLFLLQGLACQIGHWQKQIDYFSTTHRVIAMDYRGMHRSQRPRLDSHLTLEWAARDALALVDHLNIKEPVYFCGHSMGVPLSAYVTRLAPERVAKLIWICGSLDDPLRHLLFSEWAAPLFRLISKTAQLTGGALDAWWRFAVAPNAVNLFLIGELGFNSQAAPDQAIRSYLQGVSEIPFDVFVAFLEDYRKVASLLNPFPLRMPLLMIAGTHDCIIPFENQIKLHQQLSDAEFVPIDSASHNAHVDFPELTNRAIAKFLAPK